MTKAQPTPGQARLRKARVCAVGGQPGTRTGRAGLRPPVFSFRLTQTRALRSPVPSPQPAPARPAKKQKKIKESDSILVGTGAIVGRGWG